MRGNISVGAAVEQLTIRTVTPCEPVHKRPLVIAADSAMGVLIEIRNHGDRKRFIHRSIECSEILHDEAGRAARWIPWESIHLLIPELPAETIIVCIDDLGLVKLISEVFSSDWMRHVLCPEDFGPFQFSLSEEEREVDYRPDAPRITTTQHRVLHAGFKREKKTGHWFRIISAPKFLAASALRDHQWSLWDLLRFGKTAADFCRESGIPLMASAGATASKLLRLPRYYEAARRRLPRATNEAARPALRGHPYELWIEPMEPVTAVEFDQESAHPHAAATIPLPSANDLYAGYDFHNERGDKSRHEFLWRGSKRFAREIQRPGLFYLQLYGRPNASKFCPPDWRREGFFHDFVTSNEIEWLGELGISIEGIIGRWTSPTTDEGIKVYANDALTLGKSLVGFERKVIKAMFLAGLGVLGSKPHTVKILRGHEVKEGEPFTIPTREGPLTVYRREMKRTYQLAIANVIQRTMIERECAKQSWQLAAQLAAEGWEPICVYADSVFSTPPAAQMTFRNLPAPWREKMVHTHLQFKTATTYISDQASKMPGVPRLGGDARLRARQRWSEKVA